MSVSPLSYFLSVRVQMWGLGDWDVSQSSELLLVSQSTDVGTGDWGTGRGSRCQSSQLFHHQIQPVLGPNHTQRNAPHRTLLCSAASDAVLHYTILYALHINAPHYTALHCTVVIDCI